MLVGHSCGATLALQSVMGPGVLGAEEATEQEVGELGIEPPVAIVGVSGIYDLRGLRDAHADVKAYEEFLVAAFGKDEALWDSVSPARWERFRETWGTGSLMILTHSQDDELVEGGQIDTMVQWASSTWEDQGRRVLSLRNLKGRHNEIWEHGTELAEVIAVAIERLIERED